MGKSTISMVKLPEGKLVDSFFALNFGIENPTLPQGFNLNPEFPATDSELKKDLPHLQR